MHVTAHFVDKMPLNYLYCGIIDKAVPNSKMLHLTRHPMATCYAVFKTLFDRRYPFSYDLTEIAEYYIGYRRLLRHWHDTLQERLVDVSYERLVTAPAEGARVAFNFRGLVWSDAYLDISQCSTASTTASAAQVRRPIYSTSVDLWLRYEGQLAPVFERLRRAGIDIS